MLVCLQCLPADWWGAVSDDANPSSEGECVRGHDEQYVRPAVAWKPHVQRLLSLYETDAKGPSLGDSLSADWGFPDPSVAASLVSDCLPGHPLLAAGVRARPLQDGDPKGMWDRLVHELRCNNRYLAGGVLDEELLKACVDSQAGEVGPDISLFRARVERSGVSYGAQEMGPPPVGLASQGRANPHGIAYLYLAFDQRTAVHEVRPSIEDDICVAHFIPKKSLLIANLADISAPDFVNADDPAETLAVSRLLKRLGKDLSRPVRDQSDPLAYLASQFLCEWIKNHGYDGVQYKSALCPDGMNLVLFEPGMVQSGPAVDRIRVTQIEAFFESVDPS